MASTRTEHGPQFSADDDSRSPCAGRHVDDRGICAVCNVWLPEGRCLAEGCGWSSHPGPGTLVAAVEHQAASGHLVRVLLGPEPE